MDRPGFLGQVTQKPFLDFPRGRCYHGGKTAERGIPSMKTRITELFGIQYPIIQGAMHRRVSAML